MKKLTDEGAKIRFPKGNRIPYGQDFSMKRGIPSDVEFTVVLILETEDHRFQLRGPGYGEKDNYGNGAIYVSMRELENIKIEPDETPEEEPLDRARRLRKSCMESATFTAPLPGYEYTVTQHTVKDIFDLYESALTAKDEEIKRLKESA